VWIGANTPTGAWGYSFALGMRMHFQNAIIGMQIVEVLSRPWLAGRPGGYFRDSGDVTGATTRQEAHG